MNVFLAEFKAKEGMGECLYKIVKPLESIRKGNSKFYRANNMKESLRLILRSTDREEDLKLAKWYWWATHSHIDSFGELTRKIKRYMEFILNTISFDISNARIEATINKIKLLIRRSYGFRNIYSMMDMIYLTCSNLKISLPNRPFLGRLLLHE